MGFLFSETILTGIGESQRLRVLRYGGVEFLDLRLKSFLNRSPATARIVFSVISEITEQITATHLTRQHLEKR